MASCRLLSAIGCRTKIAAVCVRAVGVRKPAGTTAKIERTLSGGIVTAKFDAHFSVPQVILEAGLLMPARLARLRLDDGGGRLTDAVQKLTGLDDLIEIGVLAEGLCHKTREYRGYKSKELAVHRREFDHAIEQGRAVLAPVQVTVPSFVPSDTDDKNGAMAALGKMLSDRATELAQVVSSDLAETLKLSSTQVQNQVIAAIAAAITAVRLAEASLSRAFEMGSSVFHISVP